MWHLRTTLKYHYHICRVTALLFVISSHNTNAGRELSGKWCHRCQRLRSRSPRSNWLDAWCVMHHASPRLKLRGRSRDNKYLLSVPIIHSLDLTPTSIFLGFCVSCTNYCQLRLGQCKGNCVSDSDCRAGLVCMHGTIFECPANCNVVAISI